jgi:hypothetical protein
MAKKRMVTGVVLTRGLENSSSICDFRIVTVDVAVCKPFDGLNGCAVATIKVALFVMMLEEFL